MSEVAVCILPLLLHRAAQSGIEPVASQLPVRKQNGCFNALTGGGEGHSVSFRLAKVADWFLSLIAVIYISSLSV